MFGVLVVADAAGRVGWLRAFSGMLRGAWFVDGFAPPLFDPAARAAFWAELVERMRDFLRRSVEAADQISILGDDSVPVSYHITLWKGELLDFAILQQDAFDAIDQNTPMERQKYMLNLVAAVCSEQFTFPHFEDVGSFFKKLIHLLKQMNYCPFQDNTFNKYEAELHSLVEGHKAAGGNP